MEGLVQDFHSALDETVAAAAAAAVPHPDQQLLPKGSATPARSRNRASWGHWGRQC